MQVATGKSILNGIPIGPLRIYKKEEVQTAQTSSRTPTQEWERFESACAKAKEQLAGLYEKALDEVGEDNAAIFEIHQMMLEDEDYLDAIKTIPPRITSSCSTSGWWRPWPGKRSSSAPWTSALTSRPLILNCLKKKIPPWATGQFVFA